MCCHTSLATKFLSFYCIRFPCPFFCPSASSTIERNKWSCEYVHPSASVIFFTSIFNSCESTVDFLLFAILILIECRISFLIRRMLQFIVVQYQHRLHHSLPSYCDKHRIRLYCIFRYHLFEQWHRCSFDVIKTQIVNGGHSAVHFAKCQ